MSDETFEALKRSDVYAGLSDEQLKAVLALAEERSYAEGVTIVEEDSRAEACFFLTSGRVDIEVRGSYAGRGPQRLATLKRGEMFGELSLVDGFLRSATARAADPVTALVFENVKLEAFMQADPAAGYRIMRNVANVLAGRMRTMNMKLRNALSDILYY
jgi:CRP-like cAMP-binding protein